MNTMKPFVRVWVGGILCVSCCLILIISHWGYGITTSITPVKSYNKIYPEFIKAAIDNDLVAIRSMLSLGANPNEQSFEGTTALHWTCRNGDYTNAEEIFHVLIDAGARPYLQDENGYEVLMYTPYTIDLDRRNRYMQELFMNGGNPNSYSRLIEENVYQGIMDDDKSRTATEAGLYREVMETTKGRRKFNVLDITVNNFDRTGIIAMLNAWGMLFEGSVIETARDYAYELGFTDIGMAIEKYIKVVLPRNVDEEMILRVSPTIRRTAAPGITSLMEAIIMRDEKKVKNILERRPNLNIISTDRFRQTALNLAIKHRNFPIIEMIIKGGARVDIGDYLGNTPLHVVARVGDEDIQRKCTPLLIEAGAKLNATNNQGDTVLGQAIRMHDNSYIGYLLANYPDTLGQRTENRDNSNAIDLASRYRMPELANKLKNLPR